MAVIKSLRVTPHLKKGERLPHLVPSRLSSYSSVRGYVSSFVGLVCWSFRQSNGFGTLGLVGGRIFYPVGLAASSAILFDQVCTADVQVDGSASCQGLGNTN